MAKYMMIESRDPFDSNDVANFFAMAEGLAKQGNDVTVFLVQNGVLTARPGTKSRALGELEKAGVEVLADDFSLRERGISAAGLASGVAAAPLDIVVDHLAGGSKTIWH